jgi:hypothetical protein
MRTIKLMILVAALALSACEKNDPAPKRYKRPEEVKIPANVTEVEPNY